MTREARPRSRWLRRLAKSVALLLALFLVASLVGARVAVAGSRSTFLVAPQHIGTDFAAVTFPSRIDHLRLSGWLFHPAHPNGRSIVFVHGWQGNREDVDFVPLARAFLARGYAVLLFDLRGSGRSAGSNETLANYEPRDLLGAYDFMVHQGFAPHLMTILGNSMGAATVIEAAPQLTQVGALVCDSAFADLSGVMTNALTAFTGLPGVLALPAIEVSRAFGVLPTLSPVAIVRSLPHRAFLFIHARGDQLIDPVNARQLLAASPDRSSRLLLLDGHAHLDTYTSDPAKYLAAVLGFIDSQLARSSRPSPSDARSSSSA